MVYLGLNSYGVIPSALILSSGGKLSCSAKWQGHAEVMATNAFCPQFMTSDVEIINLFINNTEQPVISAQKETVPKCVLLNMIRLEIPGVEAF